MRKEVKPSEVRKSSEDRSYERRAREVGVIAALKEEGWKEKQSKIEWQGRLDLINKLRNGGEGLDVGCGCHKVEGFIGMDVQSMEGGDIVWDIENVPYPYEEGRFQIIVASHIVEHISSKRILDVLNEWHRLIRENGYLVIFTPLAGSKKWQTDFTHTNGWTELTANFLDPDKEVERFGRLWETYRLKPWKIIRNELVEDELEIVLERR